MSNEIMSFHSLPDVLVVAVAGFLPARDLCQLEMANKRTQLLDLEAVWRELCSTRWKNWPRYRLSESRLVWINEHQSHLDWKGRYIWAEEDVARSRITWEELESLKWFFNFTPTAGGRGDETLQPCRFLQGFLFLSQYLPMPYRLEVVANVQYLRVYHFPPHRILRLPCCGEWLIVNANVTFVSCDDNDTPTYRERGFQGNVEQDHGTSMTG
jgi:hypothetical protein